LVSVLKVGGSVQSLICGGSEFQRVGASMENALSPQVRCKIQDLISERVGECGVGCIVLLYIEILKYNGHHYQMEG